MIVDRPKASAGDWVAGRRPARRAAEAARASEMRERGDDSENERTADIQTGRNQGRQRQRGPRNEVPLSGPFGSDPPGFTNSWRSVVGPAVGRGPVPEVHGLLRCPGRRAVGAPDRRDVRGAALVARGKRAGVPGHAALLPAPERDCWADPQGPGSLM